MSATKRCSPNVFVHDLQRDPGLLVLNRLLDLRAEAPVLPFGAPKAPNHEVVQLPRLISGVMYDHVRGPQVDQGDRPIESRAGP